MEVVVFLNEDVWLLLFPWFCFVSLVLVLFFSVDLYCGFGCLPSFERICFLVPFLFLFMLGVFFWLLAFGVLSFCTPLFE